MPRVSDQEAQGCKGLGKGGKGGDRGEGRKAAGRLSFLCNSRRGIFCLGELEGENWLQFYNWKQEKEQA